MIDDAYVAAAARANGLTLTPVEVLGVVATLSRIESLAQPVLDMPLAPDDEAAPVWMP